VNLIHIAAVLMTLAAPPTPDEQRLFADGLKAFDAGDARGAERAWKEGYAVAHDPAFLVRIGEAEEKAGAPGEAADTYRHYLHEAPDASDRADIEQRISRLAPAPTAAPAPAAATHDFGAPAAPPPAAPAVLGDAENAHPSKDDEDSGWNRYNITAMTATGVTVILLGTAAFFGAEASSKESDVNRLLTNRDEMTGTPVRYSTVAAQYQSAMADGRRDAHDGRVALIGAAGTAVVAAVFFVLDDLHPTPAKVALAPTSSGAGVVGAFGWSF
jgi:hypothetical protein